MEKELLEEILNDIISKNNGDVGTSLTLITPHGESIIVLYHFIVLEEKYLYITKIGRDEKMYIPYSMISMVKV